MSLAEIHAIASRFQSRIRFRNLTEYVAAGLVVLTFGAVAILLPAPVAQAGAALIALGALYVCWKLNQLGRAASSAEMDQAASLIAFHRAELMRQREALSTVWRWYLAPFAPGVVLFLAGVAFAPEMGAPLSASVVTFVTGLAFVGATFWAVGWINAQAVKRLDAELARLDEGRG